ncbi:MAG: NAD(P)/FAD-dependent oxidoreductase [Lachnospiraceae bacterium]
MIRMNQIKVPIEHDIKTIEKKVCSILKIQSSDIKKIEIVKKSVDARKKQEISITYSLNITLHSEQVLKKNQGNYSIVEELNYKFPNMGTKIMKERPIIVGLGPAGLFCGYFLALYGYNPIIIERGKAVEERIQDVEEFWKTGVLLEESNVQFGEGGAGTFSDGKLNTLVKDKFGRNKEVLKIFVEHGADEKILYENKPHIGTDLLRIVVKNIRLKMIENGATILFSTKMTGMKITNNKLEGIICNDQDFYPTNNLILAIGHSARDTFEMLHKERIPMEAKAFAVGYRVEHPQEMISKNQYAASFKQLPPASYKMVGKGEDGEGVYSFCMCPGGYVVNASSEKNRLAINGMSYSKQDGKNANSAIIVSVSPDMFQGSSPLRGIGFQRTLEENAYRIGNGKIPIQRFGDFQTAEEKQKYNLKHCTIKKQFEPEIKGEYVTANVREILPEQLNKAFVEGMHQFGKKIPGFNDDYTIISGVESRTSSPVRITRNNETLRSEISGIYPCGEGAGYAGGITSAAMDGIYIAEKIREEYSNFTN